MLRAAALLGVEFAITDLTTVLGRTVADLVPALDEARATGVLADSGSGLAFRHPLIREALYAEMPAAVRAAWHRDAGHALAAAGAAPDRVARQLLRALGEPPGADRRGDGRNGDDGDGFAALRSPAPRPCTRRCRCSRALGASTVSDDEVDRAGAGTARLGSWR